MRSKGEEGQAIIIVALAMSIFLIGAVGLAVDGGHMYAQRQMAQTAADAAAQAGIQSIFTGTNTGTGGAGFSTGSLFTCGTSDARTPCAYASQNGFGTTDDTGNGRLPHLSTRSESLGRLYDQSASSHRAAKRKNDVDGLFRTSRIDSEGHSHGGDRKCDRPGANPDHAPYAGGFLFDQRRRPGHDLRRPPPQPSGELRRRSSDHDQRWRDG